MTNDTRSTEANLTVYLGLGSNVGDRHANLREAVARIEKLGFEVVQQSSIYETEPVGFKDQPWFLNQVIEARTRDRGPISTAEVILTQLLDVEQEMGREHGVVNGPRIIDIDLLLLGDIVTVSLKEDEGRFRAKTLRTAKTQRAGDLTVPHPRMHLRRFVLEPLCEIAPELMHPVLKKTCREIFASLDDPSIVRRYDPATADS